MVSVIYYLYSHSRAFPFFYLGHFFSFLCLYFTSREIHPHILMIIYSAKVSGFGLLFYLRLASLLGGLWGLQIYHYQQHNYLHLQHILNLNQ